MSHPRTPHFTFLCLDAFPMAPLSMAMDPLRLANTLGESDTFSWEIVTESGGMVTSSSGIRVMSDRALDKVANTDVLLTFGAASARMKRPQSSTATLRRLLAHGAKIGAVNGAIFALAEEGFFDGRNCSVHFCYAEAVAEHFPHITCARTLFSDDANRLSIAGSSAVLEYFLGQIAQHVSPAVSIEIACRFQHATLRDAETEQVLPGHSGNQTRDMLPRVVRSAVEFFSDHIEDRILIQDAADLVGLSLRQFERVFKQEMGVTPGAYYRKLRLDAARQLVMHTDQPLSEIALSVGYETVGSFASVYRRAFGASPTRDRRSHLGTRLPASALAHPLPR